MVQTTELMLKCPDIHDQADVSDIEHALSASPGIGLVEVDYQAKTVYAVTANQDGGIDIRQRLRDAGFPAVDE